MIITYIYISKMLFIRHRSYFIYNKIGNNSTAIQNVPM